MKEIVTTEREQEIHINDVDNSCIVAGIRIDMEEKVILQVVRAGVMDTYSIIHMSYSGAFHSTSYNISCAIKEFKETFPDTTFYTFDNRDEFYEWLKEQL